MFGFFLSASVAATVNCAPIAGADQLFAPQVRYVWVGEIHGTAEEPELFGDLVCLAAGFRRTIVALERSVSERASWDAYLSSDGGAGAQAAFLAETAWTWEVQDGRSSKAMLSLAERLREMKQSGKIVGVQLILNGATKGALAHEQAMGQAVVAAGANDPDALVLVLSGNLHAKRGENTRDGVAYSLAANFVPAGESRTLTIRGGGGTAWNCQSDGCGPHQRGGWDKQDRRIVLENPPSGFDGIAYTGLASTASPPAARPAAWVPLPK